MPATLLPSLRLLQLGDVHWPEFIRQPFEADYSDPDVSPDLVARTATVPSAVVFSKLDDLFPSQDIILLMGDLTDKASISDYQAFLRKLSSIAGPEQLLKVLVTPGNHDLKQSLERDDGSYDKFDPFQEALRAGGFGLLPTSEPVARTLTLGHGSNGSILILALNSCRGCGIPSRHTRLDLPAVDSLLENAAEELESLRTGGESKVWERFDTPAFDLEHLRKAIVAVSTAEPTSLPVLVAHHNLLPQTVLRVRPYAELLNGGLARSQLMATGKTLLYLHGHIHDDPVEVLTGADGTGGRVVLVSAPTLAQGFNEIVVEFNQDGRALGCIVKKWRLLRGGCVTSKDARVSMLPGGFASLAVITDAARDLHDRLPEGNFRVSAVASSGDEEETCRLLRELEWFGLVRLYDTNHSLRNWRGSAAAT